MTYHLSNFLTYSVVCVVRESFKKVYTFYYSDNSLMSVYFIKGRAAASSGIQHSLTFDLLGILVLPLESYALNTKIKCFHTKNLIQSYI